MSLGLTTLPPICIDTLCSQNLNREKTIAKANVDSLLDLSISAPNEPEHGQDGEQLWSGFPPLGPGCAQSCRDGTVIGSGRPAVFRVPRPATTSIAANPARLRHGQAVNPISYITGPPTYVPVLPENRLRQRIRLTAEHVVERIARYCDISYLPFLNLRLLSLDLKVHGFSG